MLVKGGGLNVARVEGWVFVKRKAPVGILHTVRSERPSLFPRDSQMQCCLSSFLFEPGRESCLAVKKVKSLGLIHSVGLLLVRYCR